MPTLYEIEVKYFRVFMSLDLDWVGYLTLVRIKNEEISAIKAAIEKATIK